MNPLDNLPLTGATALVTGASRGIGRAIAMKLARAGADIVVNYHRRHDDAAAVVDAVRQLGRRAVVAQADIAEPERVGEMFDQIRQEGFATLDLVVSNAASGVFQPTMQMTRKHWRWCMETNALALQSLARCGVPMMRNGGRILAISSLGASRAIPGYGFVGASKAALESLVRSLAVELGSEGITVNAVSPGAVDTDALRRVGDPALLEARFIERAVTHTALLAEDVADAVFLLCLPEARRITGHCLVVDDGFSIQP